MIKDPKYIGKNPIKGKRDAPYVGPYIVLRYDQNGNLELKDPSDGSIFGRRVPPDQVKLKSEMPDEEPVYEVDHIIAHRGTKPRYQYLVRWKGCSKSQDSWEPPASFIDTQCISDYWKSVNTKPNSK